MNKTVNELKKQVDIICTQAAVLRQMVMEAFPRVSYYDVVLADADPVSTGVIAEDYGLEADDLYAMLEKLDMVEEREDGWVPEDWVTEKGYAFVGTPRCKQYNDSVIVAWTQKGRLFLYEKLRRCGILPLVEEENCCDGCE